MKILGISHGKVRFNDLPKPQIIYPDDILVKIQYALLPPDDLELYLGGNMIIPNPYTFGQAGSGSSKNSVPPPITRGCRRGTGWSGSTARTAGCATSAAPAGRCTAPT